MPNIKIITMKLLSILFFSVIIFSCSSQSSTDTDPKIDLTEGKLIYSISGEGTSSSWELEILFNQNNAVIQERYAFGSGKKFIYDKKENEILGLIDDPLFFGIVKDRYIIYYTQQQLITESLSTTYGDTTIVETKEFKDILGYNCQKSIIKYGDQVVVEVWLTDKIKPGITYPWTPLTLDKIALEYEMKILGRTDRKYSIKSISCKKIDRIEFEHIVPEQYYLVVPASVFSTNILWSKQYEKNTFHSFTYPYYKAGRQSTIQYIQSQIGRIVTENSADISIEFLVNKDGRISDIKVLMDHKAEDNRIEDIVKFIKSMKPWTPAMVRGNPVKSKVLVFV